VKTRSRRTWGSGTYCHLGTDARGYCTVKLVVDLPGVRPRRRATRQVHCRARDIDRELAAFREQVGHRAQGSVGELVERWLESRRGKAPGSYAAWESLVRCHLAPALGRRPVCELGPLEIDAYLRGLAIDGRSREHRGKHSGLSPRTVRQHYAVLRQVFRWAVRKRLIDHSQNPMPAVDLPAFARTERPLLSDTELAALLQAARDTALYLPIVLAATTGARRGEILALTWGDVDLGDGLVHIRRALNRVRGTTIVGEPKTHSSKGTLVLMAETVNALARERERQHRLAETGWQNRHNLLCPSREGDYCNPNSFSARFCELRDRLRAQGKLAASYCFHDLRHYHLSCYQRAARDPAATRARARHASLSMTDRYVHPVFADQRRASAALDATIGAVLRNAGEDGTQLALEELAQ
jgi:integrase